MLSFLKEQEVVKEREIFSIGGKNKEREVLGMVKVYFKQVDTSTQAICISKISSESVHKVVSYFLHHIIDKIIIDGVEFTKENEVKEKTLSYFATRSNLTDQFTSSTWRAILAIMSTAILLPDEIGKKSTQPQLHTSGEKVAKDAPEATGGDQVKAA